MKKYWMCIIGGVDPSIYKGNGADGPLRSVIRNKYNEIFGPDETCSSGWGIDEERFELLMKITNMSTEDLKKLLI